MSEDPLQSRRVALDVALAHEPQGRKRRDERHDSSEHEDVVQAGDEALTRWLAEHPDCDSQRLRSLVRAARRDGAALTPEMRQPKSFRELFQFRRPQIHEPPAP